LQVKTEMTRPTETTITKPDELGEAIAAARQRAGVTQAELADWLQVGRTAVVDLESGMDVRRLRRLMEALDVLGLELVVRPKRAR
jgi:HTH-type transcriptional regulator / antitoxin HipB